jgi:hypothetical protein
VNQGRGDAAVQVLRTKFTLHDKRAAIEDLNKMFGWVVDKREVGRPGDFAGLSDAELEKEFRRQSSRPHHKQTGAWRALARSTHRKQRHRLRSAVRKRNWSSALIICKTSAVAACCSSASSSRRFANL